METTLLPILNGTTESSGEPNTQNDEFYQTYKDAGPSLLLIAVASLVNLISVPGIFMNLAIVYVSFKYRSLRGSSSSFLLALTALYEAVHALGHLLFLYVALSGLNFLPVPICFRFLVVPFFANMASLCTIALTGLDRFVQLAFDRIDCSHPVFLTVYFLLTFVAGALSAWKYWQFAHQLGNDTLPRTGFIGDLMPADDDGGHHSSFHLRYMMAMQLLAVVFYLAIWALLKVKTASASIHAHILKSMVVIIAINIGGYLLNTVVRLFLIPALGLAQGQTLAWVLETGFGIVLNICVTLNAVVLYICSTEYRKCFQEELRRLFHRQNRVVAISQHVVVPSTSVRNGTGSSAK